MRLFDAIHANSASPQTVRSVASASTNHMTKSTFTVWKYHPSYLLTVAFEYIATGGWSITVVGRRPPSAKLICEKYKSIGLACLLWLRGMQIKINNLYIYTA